MCACVRVCVCVCVCDARVCVCVWVCVCPQTPTVSDCAELQSTASSQFCRPLQQQTKTSEACLEGHRGITHSPGPSSHRCSHVLLSALDTRQEGRQQRLQPRACGAAAEFWFLALPPPLKHGVQIQAQHLCQLLLTHAQPKLLRQL